MKLQQHVLNIRKMIHTAFQSRFERLGLYEHSQRLLAEIALDLQEKMLQLDWIVLLLNFTKTASMTIQNLKVLMAKNAPLLNKQTI